MSEGWLEARELDATDPLAEFRLEFSLPAGRIYLDGNSLGPLSKASEAATIRALGAWKNLAIGGWLEADPPWFTMAEDLARRMAPLVGASDIEVIVTGSTTANLHQCLATFFQPDGRRTKILADALSFPSDLYAIQSHLKLRGLDPSDHLILVPSEDGRTLSEARVEQAMGDDVAVAILPTVVYRSGQLLDVERVARAGRNSGVLVGFDASHSVGAVPHRFDAWGVDFAFWCSYKYLNGGPGAVGALYVNSRHFDRRPGLAGWFGSRKDRQFDMAPTFEPAEGAGGFQVGTPPILSMSPLLGALEVIEAAGIEAIRRKSLALTAYLRALVDRELLDFGFGFATPSEDARRGGHLAITHPEASRIARALVASGVIPDHRPPDIVRLAPVALYTRFEDCFEAVARLKAIMEHRSFEAFPSGRPLVS